VNLTATQSYLVGLPLKHDRSMYHPTSTPLWRTVPTNIGMGIAICALAESTSNGGTRAAGSIIFITIASSWQKWPTDFGQGHERPRIRDHDFPCVFFFDSVQLRYFTLTSIAILLT
jgi:hypothetical protein